MANGGCLVLLVLLRIALIAVLGVNAAEIEWAKDVRAWAYHPDNVRTDTVISNVFAGVRVTLHVLRWVSDSSDYNASTALDLNERIRVISGASRCGAIGSAKSSSSIIRFPLPGNALDVVNTSEVEVLEGEGVISNVSMIINVNVRTDAVTLQWFDLAFLESGRFRICYCPGNAGQCDTDAEFGSQAGEILAMGPTAGQTFSCAAGWPCDLGPVSGEVQVGSKLRVMASCYAPVQTLGFLPGTGVGAGSNETEAEDLLNDPAVSEEAVIPGQTFSWGLAEVLGPGAQFELCWCAGQYEGCNRTENFLVRVGSLIVPGPQRPVEVLCAAGRLCHFAFAPWLGVDLDPGDLVMVLPNCRGNINFTMDGWPNGGITQPATNKGHDFMWDRNWVNLTAPPTGTNRLCWCHRSRSCMDSDDFRLDVGSITVAGPRGDQAWLCTMGQGCAINSIQGTMLAVDDHYRPLKRCGVESNVTNVTNVTGFLNGHVIASSMRPALSANSSNVTFQWDTVNASAGPYKLCWTTTWQRPSASSCAELLWNNPSEGSALTCAQTKFSGSCAEISLQSADSLCAAQGARLCLPHEIVQGEIRGSACASESGWIWTSQSCGSGFQVVARMDSGESKCVATAVHSPVFVSQDVLMSMACCADDQGIGSDTSVAWFTNSGNYATSAGTLTVRGPFVQNAYCAVGDICIVEIKGVLLNQGVDSLQIINSNQKCGTSTVAALSQDFATSRANATVKASALEEYSLGKSSTFGIFRMCWCSLGQSSCSLNADFSVNAGELLVGGINQHSFRCIYAVPCVVSLNGTNLGGADSVLVVPATLQCSQATSGTMRDALVFNNPATTQDVADTNVKTFNLGAIMRQGAARICYCISFGTRACTDSSAALTARFSLEAGVVTVYGAFLNVTLPNGRTGVPYSLLLTGSELSILNRITMQRVDSGPSCGSLGSNVSDVLVSIPTNAPTSVTTKGTEESWYGVAVAKAGNFRVCWCAGDTACDAPGGFSLQAGLLAVDGIEESFAYPTQIVGNPFQLTLHGNQLRPSDRIVFMPKALVSKCGDRGTMQHMTGRVAGVSGVPATSLDVEGVAGAQEFWRDVSVLAVGEYIVCWCGHTSCIEDVHFATEATRLLVTGPDVHNFPHIVAGELFDIMLHGSGLGSLDRISIVDFNVECGAPQADLLSSVVVAPTRTLPNLQMNMSSVGTTQTSAEELGEPSGLLPNGTSQAWSGLMIRWQGTYKLCWAGNHTLSRRCVEVSNYGNCSVYESAFHPFHVGNLKVIYGNASVVGETRVARCDSLDVMAFSPRPPPANSSQLSALRANWTCSPPQNEICTTLQTFLDSTGAGKLHLHVPADFLTNMLDRAQWVANSLGLHVPVQSFKLSVLMIDTHNVTRWGSLAISISNAQPLVQGLPTKLTITLADELHLAVYINPPGGITCSAPSDLSGAATTVSWLLVSSTATTTAMTTTTTGIPTNLTSQNRSLANLTVQSRQCVVCGSDRNFILSAEGIAALGLGVHNISALVSFADSAFLSQEVFFFVHVVDAPDPMVTLSAPSTAGASCPLVVHADSSKDGVYPAGSFSYTWSCTNCSLPLAASSGPFQIIPGSSLTSGQHHIEVQARAVNGQTTSSSTNITVDSNVTTNTSWSFLPILTPAAVRFGKELACEAVSVVAGALCAPPTNVTWSLQHIHANGSTSSSPDTQLITQRSQFSVGSQPVSRFAATIPMSMMRAGGHYRCILRGGDHLVHTGSAMLVVGPPTGGRLVVAPNSGIALETRFTLTSVDWMTDHIPVMHAFLTIPGSPSANPSTTIDVGMYLRGWDSDNVMGCVFGVSGRLQIIVRARDTLGGIGVGVAVVDVHAPTQPINYDVERMAQWPPNERSLTGAAAALVTAALAEDVGNFSGSSSIGGASAAVSQLLTGLWTAVQSSSLGKLHQEDLALRAWVLERTLFLTGATGPNLTQCFVAAQILEQSAAQTGALSAMATRGLMIANTTSRLLAAASTVSIAMAKSEFGTSQHEADQILSLLRDFERQLGEAMLVQMRRTSSLFEWSTLRLEQATGGGMSTAVATFPRGSAVAGLEIPALGLTLEVSALPSAANRRLGLAGETLKAACRSDTAELQLTRWRSIALMNATAFAQQLQFEGSLSDVQGNWSSAVGKSDPHVVTIRLWICPEGLQHVSGISVKFAVPGGTVGHGYSEEVRNSTTWQLYHINITWFCAQWDHTLGLWRASTSMIKGSSASSIECISVLGTSDNAVHLATFPGARRTLFREVLIHSVVKADDGLTFTTANWLPLIIAVIALYVPLIALCFWDLWHPPIKGQVGGCQQPVGEMPSPMLVLMPSMSFFEGLFHNRACKLCTCSCRRRRRQCFERPEAIVYVEPNFVPCREDAELQLQTQPPLRQDVLTVAQEALEQLKEAQVMREARRPGVFRRSCCCLRKDVYAVRQRKLLKACLAGYRSLLVGSDHYRRTMKQFGAEADDYRADAALDKLDIDISKNSIVDPADEAFVLRVAHHVQQWLGDVSDIPEGIRLSGEEELSLKCCQQALRRAYLNGVKEVGSPCSGLTPQPFFAPLGAARLILVSLETIQPKNTVSSSPRSSPMSRKRRSGRNSRRSSAAGSEFLGTNSTKVFGVSRSFSGLIVPERANRAWEETGDTASPGSEASPVSTEAKAQMFLADSHYFMWTQDKTLFIHRAETSVQDTKKAARPLDQTLAIHESTRAYHLECDVDEIAMCPNDDRYITLNLFSGMKSRWRIDGEIRNWIEGLQRQAPPQPPTNIKSLLMLRSSAEAFGAQLKPSVFNAKIHDTLHCWQPSMQGDSSSCFFYSLQGFPHMASDIHLETVTGFVSPAVMWHSHGGTALSFALLAVREDTPSSRGTANRGRPNLQIQIPGEVPSKADPNEAIDRTGQAECNHQVIGAYLSDILSIRSEVRNSPDAGTLKYCMEITFSDGTRLRPCFNSRFMRLACQRSLSRLRALSDPGLPSIRMAAPPVLTKNAMAAIDCQAAREGIFQTASDASGASGVFQTASDASGASGLWGGASPRLPISLSDAFPRRLPSKRADWKGVTGVLEIRILSASSIGLTDNSQLNLTGVASLGRYRAPLPCPRVCVHLAPQPPPLREEMRRTPDLSERSANPIWNSTWFYTVEYSAKDPLPAPIKLEVWNVDGRNDFLGEIVVPFPLEDCLTQHHLDLQANSSKVQPGDEGKDVNGTLSFQLVFKTERAEKSAQDVPSPRSPLSLSIPCNELVNVSQFRCVCGTLGIEVIRAIGLRSADLLTSDPYCVVLVSTAPRQHTSWKTSTRYATLHPLWRELKEFQINWPLDGLETASQIKIEIWDHDSMSNDEFLGEVSFSLPTGDGENFIDIEVQPNRSKSPNTVKGRLQARVFFKNQFTRDESEGDLHPYEDAFCQYFGTEVVDEQFARSLAPPLIFFHIGWRRILVSQFRDALRRASHDLVASKSARGMKSRTHCYLDLVSSLSFGVGVAAAGLGVMAHFDIKLSYILAAVVGAVSAILAPCPANCLATFLWHRPEPLASVAYMGLGRHSWSTPGGLSVFALFISLVGIAAFLSLCQQEAVDHLWVATSSVVLMRLLLLPLFHSLRLTGLLVLAKSSGMNDWFLRLFPSVMTARGALLQRLPGGLPP